MAGFSPIETPNFAQAALGGYNAGRAMGKQKREEAGLQLYATDPEAGINALTAAGSPLAEQLRANLDRREKRAALAGLYAPHGAQPQQQALGAPSAPVEPSGASPMLSPEANAMVAPPAAAAPATPPALPPTPPARADGVTINQDALARLFQVDPQMAIQVRQFAATARKEQIAEIQAHAELKALAATYAKQFPEGPERNAAFAQMRPELEARGFSPADLDKARLDDMSLNKDITFGMGLKDLVAQERAERQEKAANADRAADNARADAGLGIRRSALDLAQSRGASGPRRAPLAGPAMTGMSDEALMAIAAGSN